MRDGERVRVALTIRPARPADVAALAPHLRQADADEVRAAAGASPHAALQASYDRSPAPLAAVAAGRVVALMGVVPLPSDPSQGTIWLLGSADLVAFQLSFWRACLATLPVLVAPYRRVLAVVDARYEASLRWLRHLGFSRHGSTVRGAGPGGLPMVVMERWSDGDSRDGPEHV